MNKGRLPLIRHTGLEVDKLPRALVFWEKTVGLELVSVVEEPWYSVWPKLARLRDMEGNTLELVEGPWRGHVSVGVKEWPKRWAAEVPQPVKRGRLWVWFGEDPDGKRVELVKEGG